MLIAVLGNVHNEFKSGHTASTALLPAHGLALPSLPTPLSPPRP